ncbi:GGDEF domain-containing protein [Sphingomonas sp.]|uniref:GGDEF domain-containing protein n=1 Tax=Sphingomonas sp. TaxID=28214 RepID=UPI002FD8A210
MLILGVEVSVRSPTGLVLFRCLLLSLLCLLAGPARAWAPPAAGRLAICHAVSTREAPDAIASTLPFDCAGKPENYQSASLWLRLDPRSAAPAGDTTTLLIHNTRFDRMLARFDYADGTSEMQQVRSGAFDDHWRPGAQIAFRPENGKAALVRITLRIDRLSSYPLLRMRLVDAGEADIETTILAGLIGAALTLLLAGALYNLTLALGVRRQYFAWQGAWAGSVFLWGTVWSQFGLLVAPGLAGTLAAQLSTAVSVLSIPFATLSVTTALAPGMAPRRLKQAALVLGATVVLLGIPAALVRGPVLESLAPALSIATLGTLVCAMLCLAWGLRRGSPEARDLLGAWSIPSAALALTQIVDIGGSLWGGGPQILVLFASAWQTIWLSIAASRRLARLRAERDVARAAEARASELAGRDPLTGLHNRRGFVDASEALMLAASTDGAPLALLLIDIDRFKRINDEHGHEAGDIVLCTIASRLARWGGPMCTVARLGGEEFAMVVAHLSGQALLGFADHVRQEIAACDHGAVIGAQQVTISIGVAEAGKRYDFTGLYRSADRALYAAKHGGRNRVRHANEDAQVPAARGQSPAATGPNHQRVG